MRISVHLYLCRTSHCELYLPSFMGIYPFLPWNHSPLVLLTFLSFPACPLIVLYLAHYWHIKVLLAEVVSSWNMSESGEGPEDWKGQFSILKKTTQRNRMSRQPNRCGDCSVCCDVSSCLGREMVSSRAACGTLRLSSCPRTIRWQVCALFRDRMTYAFSDLQDAWQEEDWIKLETDQTASTNNLSPTWCWLGKCYDSWVGGRH